MYDVTNPRIELTMAANVNTIEGKNYYSDISTLALDTIDDQSGIRFDGTEYYTASSDYENNDNVKKVAYTIHNESYSLRGIDPHDIQAQNNGSLKINGITDYVGNVMPDSDALIYSDTDDWVKQTAPELPGDDFVSIIDWAGTYNGTSNYTSELIAQPDGSRKIEVKSPRSVTSLTFGLKVISCDEADMLGWIITTEPLTSFDDFYARSRVGSEITVLNRNSSDEYEYIYRKPDSTYKWEEISNKKQYFYAINRAGLICHKPIIVEFIENPVPAISS